MHYLSNCVADRCLLVVNIHLKTSEIKSIFLLLIEVEAIIVQCIETALQLTNNPNLCCLQVHFERPL